MPKPIQIWIVIYALVINCPSQQTQPFGWCWFRSPTFNQWSSNVDPMLIQCWPSSQPTLDEHFMFVGVYAEYTTVCLTRAWGRLLFKRFVWNFCRIIFSPCPNIYENLVECCCVFSKLDLLASNLISNDKSYFTIATKHELYITCQMV